MKMFVYLCFVVTVSFATSPLSLHDALEKLKSNNHEIDIAKRDEHISALEAEVATASSLGSLDLSHNLLRSNDALNIFGYKLQSREARFTDFGFRQLDMSNPNYDAKPSDLNEPPSRNHFSTQLTYSLPLYSGGKISYYKKITKALHHLSTLTREETSLQKQYEVKKTFYDIALVKDYITDLAFIEKTMQKLYTKAAALREEGYAKKVDLLEIETRLAEVGRHYESAKANEAMLYHYLSFLLDETVSEIITPTIETLSFEIHEEAILNDNIRVKQAAQNLEISKMNIALEESAYYPQIGAFVQYGSADNHWMNDFSKNDAYTVGVQIKWNLFNGGADKANVEKARVHNLKAQQAFILSQKSLLLHVKQLQTKLHTYVYEIKSLKKEVELAQMIYENYAGRYEQKLLSIHEVMLKQTEALQAVLKLKEAQNAHNDTIFELEKIARSTD
ncbi:TolC family protein [Sulfurospirillum barnesii]|uniref:Outer membrane protein n=1 Tax=Sulfurospirillum barnesii (strain ATCC 700032 / DSM 10660 / SES-3) TaxID=760154 RepID=I3XVK5_SULBS|nr:TolC family protein [Sulfurospirillum barnesii]AFL67979.1 outer membrane protein [Sulfurospirillum barnesii SES-3]